MVDSSTNTAAQSLPLSRCKMPALFFSDNLTEDFENQGHKLLPNLTGNFTYPH